MNFLIDPHSPPGFPHAESHVRAVLGWNKDEMRSARKIRLAPGDFTVFKKRLFLSTLASSKLSALLSPSPAQKNAPAAPGSIADDFQPVTRPLIICNPRVANPRLVLACPAEENPDRPQNLFRVRIRPGTLLRRRQAIMARSIPPYTDYFELLLTRGGQPQIPPVSP